MKWQELEKIVKIVSEAKFGGTARAENIAGVKCDCVINLNEGRAVIIEISKQNNINKLRTDLAKFNTIRPHFFKKIFPLTAILSPRKTLHQH